MDILFDSFDSDWEDWTELTEQLNCINDPVKITGTLGLWNGTHEIEPVECNNMTEAINKCLGRDTDAIIFKFDGENYYIDCVHHDGTNKFKLEIQNDDI